MGCSWWWHLVLVVIAQRVAADDDVETIAQRIAPEDDIETIRNELRRYPGCGPHVGPKRKVDPPRQGEAQTSPPTPTPAPRVVRTRRDTTSETKRFAYLVGLEHTGHHLWHRHLFPQLKLGHGINEVARVVLELEDPHCIAEADAPKLAANESWDFRNGSAPHGVSRATRLRMIRRAFEFYRPATRHVVGIQSCSYPCQADHRTPDVVVPGTGVLKRE